MLKFNTKLFKILKVQSNSYSSRLKERWILFLYFRIENIPAFLLRQRPVQDIKLLDSITPEAFPIRVLTMWDRDEKKSLFPKQQHHPSPAPRSSSKVLLTPSWAGTIVQSLFHNFSIYFPYIYCPVYTGNEASQVIPFCLEQNKVDFFCKSFLHIQYS